MVWDSAMGVRHLRKCSEGSVILTWRIRVTSSRDRTGAGLEGCKGFTRQPREGGTLLLGRAEV